MSFGAMAAWQALLFAGAVGALAAALFLIKVRPPHVTVPSLLFWRRVLDESRELTLWERIRRAVSLVITILIALALALAITRPGRAAGARSAIAGRTLIVIDTSWSMLARTATGETRWDRALAETRRLIAATSGAEVALATTGDGLVEGPTTDTTLVETALDRIAPGAADLAAWPRLAGTAAVYFVTDGANARPLDANVMVHSVYESAPNVAITALDVRPSLAESNAGDAYLEIGNFSSAAQKVRVTLTRGTARIFDRELDMGSTDVLRQVVPLVRSGDAALRARVSAPDNALEIDDEAVSWIAGAKQVSIQVVGHETTWLQRALARHPGGQVTFTDPAGYVPGHEDVTIYVGWAPASLPARPSLLFAPPLTTAWLHDGEGSLEDRPRWETPGSHPVIAGVDPFTLSIERARSYAMSSLAPVAQSTRGTPLVSVSESPDRRMIVVSFGADESNLAGAPGFPVLLGNALDWLTNPAAQSGQPYGLGLVSFGAGVAKVTGPDGEDVSLSRVNQTTVGVLRRPGFYLVEGGGARSTLAVNAGDPQLSNLMRRPSNMGTQSRVVEAGGSGRPWWIYCVMVAFVVALAEWWTWQRRITV